jgi:DNA repair exonuclease SbcCD nuclease subunit
MLSVGFARAQLPTLPERNLNFIVVSDTGAPAKKQASVVAVAGQLEKVVTNNNISFVAVAGDPIHQNGVQNVKDPEWQIKVESVFKAPVLHTLPWYVISGNHEYSGSVPAVLAYANVSPRWNAPARYYAFQRSLGHANAPVLFLFLDTTPLIDGYHAEEDRSDVKEQDPRRELQWMDSTLTASNAGWKIVFGHHPVHAHTTKSINERVDMQCKVGTILEKRNVDFYIGGHIHNFQYIKPQGTKVNYIVNASGHTSRPVEPIEGSVAYFQAPGFSLYSVSKDAVDFYFINEYGQTLYHGQVKK